MEEDEVYKMKEDFQNILQAQCHNHHQWQLDFEKSQFYWKICIAALTFCFGYFVAGVTLCKASELDDCKSQIYHQTRTIRRASEHAQNLCRAQKLPVEKCDKIGREVLKEKLATLPKLDNNFILKCESRGVYSSVDRI